MRNDPSCLREQANIRFLSLAAIIAAIGLTWLSWAGLPQDAQWPRPKPDSLQTLP